MKIDEKDKQFLLKNIEAAQTLIEADDVDGLLEEIDGFMTEKGYAPPNYDELNATGREAERVYDRIYNNN